MSSADRAVDTLVLSDIVVGILDDYNLSRK